ncbi:GNAT family N-acetyltransferase [Phyllobacterium sp. BT25]|uniref:GNAT family N-acetyltransferase n=1 Tax=Phyllobacterium pellucidum TaxID=2740464 RepID=A0A849VPE3_9HYPH|nr:GNAT family N-acetyltransferase [Phyllobacterium pellucidum]NTS31792.1 GNAT family N-acetyltransferase [Phyllobacterium pellucidum]
MVEPMQIAVRRLTRDDAERFQALRLHCLQTAPEAFGSSYEEECGRDIAEIRSMLEAQPNAVFGAFAGDQLVGLAGFAVSPKAKKRHVGLLWGVFVDPAWRGHDLGRRLTAAEFTFAKSFHSRNTSTTPRWHRESQARSTPAVQMPRYLRIRSPERYSPRYYEGDVSLTATPSERRAFQ